MDDKEFLELIRFKAETLDEKIEWLERLLACDRTELIIYRPELEMRLANLKEAKKAGYA